MVGEPDLPNFPHLGDLHAAANTHGQTAHRPDPLGAPDATMEDLVQTHPPPIAATSGNPATTSGEPVPLLDKILLIGAPLLMALGRVFLVPIDDDHLVTTMADAGTHQARSDFGWVLAIIASGLLSACATGLARTLRRSGRPGAAGFALVTTAVGWAGCAAICLGGLVLSEAAEATDRAAMAAFVTDFNEGAIGWAFLLSAIGAVGYVVLAISLGRSKAVSKTAATLLGIGGATTLVTMGGPLTVVLATTAILLAVGQGLASRSLGVAAVGYGEGGS